MTKDNKYRDWRSAVRFLSDNRIEIPVEVDPAMRVPGIIYTDRPGVEDLVSDESPSQVMNVATLPGIMNYSLAMPDIHYGYGFPIGGVAAFSVSDGVISPGGVGFDINCGVRLLSSSIRAEDVRRKADALCSALFSEVPCGMGAGGDIYASGKDMEGVLKHGARWAVKKGYGWNEDIELCEESGALEVDNLDVVSGRARERGRDQLGSLGSGNHFIEVQEVAKVYDESAARAMGLVEGSAAVMIHSGSRGLGAQVCQDSIRLMGLAASKYHIELPDRQLACAPVRSREGEEYYAAMSAAANYAWANRHCLAHRVRLVFERVFGAPAEKLGMHLVYDVAHNIAKFERHTTSDGKTIELCVHRKGATRAFPAGHPDIPERYRAIGQPAIVPGDMGRASYVLIGTRTAMEETWGSICHGAGRAKSRTNAKSSFTARDVLNELSAKGIVLQAKSKKSIVEEAPQAYKNINRVVETCVRAGLATQAVKLKPIVVIKG